MYNVPRDGWKNLEAAHRMGVSWGQIWTIIGVVAFIAILGFAVSVFIGQQNSKMVQKKIDEATKNTHTIQIDIEKNIQDQVNQKLREAGIEQPTQN